HGVVDLVGKCAGKPEPQRLPRGDQRRGPEPGSDAHGQRVGESVDPGLGNKGAAPGIVDGDSGFGPGSSALMRASVCAMSAGRLSPAALACCSAAPLIVTVKRPLTRCSVTGFTGDWLAAAGWPDPALCPLHPATAASRVAEEINST